MFIFSSETDVNLKASKTEIVVIGAGPGGYAAAFYAADKGKKVVLIEQEKRLGGVCLNRGCIPSKALLHASKLITEAAESGIRGIHFQKPSIDLVAMRAWKNSILEKLAGGIAGLAQKRNVEVMTGRGYFEDSQTLRVETENGQKYLTFDQAIIAVGSKASMPAAFDLGNPRIMTSTEALEIEEIPKSLLVVGGGYIGMELGTVYATLGSSIVVVEALEAILAGADADLARPVVRRAEKLFKEIRVKTKVVKMATAGKLIKVNLEVDGEKKEELYDGVLVSVGRVPNCDDFGLENTKVKQDEKGFIRVNDRQQTDDPGIFAIGDVAGGVLLAHKATKEARIAVEVITGEMSVFEDIIIPAVVFTDPELAWCGLTEAEARQKNIPVEVAKFPWSASGRALSFDRTDGLTKLIIDPDTERILGVGIVGAGAGELIGEGVVALEMGATARDLAESVHPHPTLSETLSECAEAFYGTATHAYTRKKPPAEPRP
jgi:dihydrolipoamide dehydrogenase